MPEAENQLHIGKLEVQVDAIKEDVSELKTEVKTLNGNIVTALTEMKVSQAKFETTTEKVNGLDVKVHCLKKDHIDPMMVKQNSLDYQARITKWVAVVFFAGLMYALADKVINLF